MAVGRRKIHGRALDFSIYDKPFSVSVRWRRFHAARVMNGRPSVGQEGPPHHSSRHSDETVVLNNEETDHERVHNLYSDGRIPHAMEWQAGGSKATATAEACLVHRTFKVGSATLLFSTWPSTANCGVAMYWHLRSMTSRRPALRS